ncbi:hypothetical protein D3C76_830390 [compost metagenome]
MIDRDLFHRTAPAKRFFQRACFRRDSENMTNPHRPRDRQWDHNLLQIVHAELRIDAVDRDIVRFGLCSQIITYRAELGF